MTTLHEHLLISNSSSATAAVFEICDEDSAHSEKRPTLTKSVSVEFDSRRSNTYETDAYDFQDQIIIEKRQWEALEIQNRVYKSDKFHADFLIESLKNDLSAVETQRLDELRWSVHYANYRERLLEKRADSLTFQQLLGDMETVPDVNELKQQILDSNSRINELEQVVALQHAKITGKPNRTDKDFGYSICKSGISSNIRQISQLVGELGVLPNFLNELRQIDARMNELEEIQCIQENKILEQAKANNELKQIIVGMNLAGKRKETAESILLKYNDLRNEYLDLKARFSQP